MIYKLQSNRVYRSYYGGKRLDALYGKEKCADTQFPEEWIASTVKAFNVRREHLVEGLSLTDSNNRLIDIIADAPKAILGEAQYEKHHGRLSILVKLLDASERLFIQCHPTVTFAKKHFHSDFGKTECWYVLSAEDNACVYLGFQPEITKKEWKRCFETQDIDQMLRLLHRLQVHKGDLIFVEGGMPHAIGGGCLLCELQEPSDYMVIPERTSKSGITLSDEKMHGGLGWEKMLDCFCYDGITEDDLRSKYVRHPVMKENQWTPLVDGSLTDKFSMNALRSNGEFVLPDMESYSVAVITNGSCEMLSIH